MNDYTDFSNNLLEILSRFKDYLPSLLSAIGLLLIGWAVAYLLRVIAVRLAHVLDQMIHRFTRRTDTERPETLPAWGRVFGSVVFWLVILMFLTLATQVLGLETFSDWLNRVAGYLPTLLVGALIIFAGFLVSALTRDLVIATAPVEERQAALLGRLTQGVILLLAIVIGADQIGINVTFLVIVAAVILATVLGGIALAISLGAKTFVANLISGHELRQIYQVGQPIRIANYEGKIVELTPTTVVLETTEGYVSLPAKFFSEQPTVLLDRRNGDG